MVAKVPIIPTSASAQHSGSGSAYNRGNFQGWDGREKWRTGCPTNLASMPIRSHSLLAENTPEFLG